MRAECTPQALRVLIDCKAGQGHQVGRIKQLVELYGGKFGLYPINNMVMVDFPRQLLGDKVNPKSDLLRAITFLMKDFGQMPEKKRS